MKQEGEKQSQVKKARSNRDMGMPEAEKALLNVRKIVERRLVEHHMMMGV